MIIIIILPVDVQLLAVLVGIVELPVLLQYWIPLQTVPTPVDQAETRDHDQQDLVVLPDVPQPHDSVAPRLTHNKPCNSNPKLTQL